MSSNRSEHSLTSSIVEEIPTDLNKNMDSADLSVALAISGGFGKYQTRLIFVMIPITISGVFCASSVSFILPAIVCEMQISKYKQGFLFSAVYIGMVIGGFFWGMIADSIGRRKTLIIILGITSLMEMTSAFTLTYWSLFATKVCSGFTNSGIMTTFVTYTTEFIDGRNRDKMTMRVGCFTALGYFLQPIIATIILPLRFKYSIYGDLIYLNSWKLFILVGSLPAFCGFLVALFFLYESPAFLLRRDRQNEAMRIVQYIYSKNTGKPRESFPAKKLYLKEDEERLQEEKEVVQSGKKIGWKDEVSAEMKPLFHFPFLVPTLLVFLNQFITMAAFNAVRSHQATMFAMALGIGQIETLSPNITKLESLPFCTLFETQHIFKKSIKCSQETISLNRTLYVCVTFVGFFMFSSFIPITEAVKKFGKKCVFLTAHTVCAICVSLIPWSSAVVTVVLVCIFCSCLQNCITLNIGLMLGRVPTSMRGATISLIMIFGRFGVVAGSQILPVFTNISCIAAFLCVAIMNLSVYPIVYIFSRQPNPLREKGIKLMKELDNQVKT